MLYAYRINKTHIEFNNPNLFSLHVYEQLLKHTSAYVCIPYMHICTYMCVYSANSINTSSIGCRQVTLNVPPQAFSSANIQKYINTIYGVTNIAYTCTHMYVREHAPDKDIPMCQIIYSIYSVHAVYIESVLACASHADAMMS